MIRNKILIITAALAICPAAFANVAAFDSRIASDAEQASKDGFVWKDAAAFPLESKVCASTATPYGRIPADMMDKVPPGREDGIRTRDFLVPNQARYQAALLLELEIKIK